MLYGRSDSGKVAAGNPLSAFLNSNWQSKKSASDGKTLRKVLVCVNLSGTKKCSLKLSGVITISIHCPRITPQWMGLDEFRYFLEWEVTPEPGAEKTKLSCFAYPYVQNLENINLKSQLKTYVLLKVVFSEITPCAIDFFLNTTCN